MSPTLVLAVLAVLLTLGTPVLLPLLPGLRRTPAAGLLLRLGQPDLLGIAFVAAAGEAIFAHLGLLFAIGVAVGIARENHGAAGLGQRKGDRRQPRGRGRNRTGAHRLHASVTSGSDDAPRSSQCGTGRPLSRRNTGFQSLVW